MIKQPSNPTEQQPEQYESSEKAAPAAEKRPFVEPSVSVPADVLEATALFQAPTLTVTITN